MNTVKLKNNKIATLRLGKLVLADPEGAVWVCWAGVVVVVVVVAAVVVPLVVPLVSLVVVVVVVELVKLELAVVVEVRVLAVPVLCYVA